MLFNVIVIRCRALLSRGVAKAAVLSVLNCGIRLLAGIWLTPLLLMNLGVDGYGRWVLLLNVLTFLFFFDLGIFPTLRNRMGTAYEMGQKRSFEAYAFTTFVIGGCVVLLGLASVAPALAILRSPLSDLLSAEGGRNAVIGVIVYGSLNTALYCVDTIMMAQSRFGLLRICDLIANISYIGGTILVIRLGGSLFWLVTVYLFPRVFVRIVLACSDMRKYWWTKACSLVRFIRILRLCSIDALQYSGVKVTEIVMTTAPAFLIAKLGSIQDVAEYGAHLRIAVVPNLIVVSILPIFWSDLTNRFAKGDTREVLNLYYIAILVIIVGFSGWALFIGMSSQLVSQVLFAKRIAFDWTTMSWLLAYYLVQTLAMITMTIMNSRSYFGTTLGLTTSCAVVCIGGTAVLSVFMNGMTAVLVGFTVGWLLTGFLPGHYFVCQICNEKNPLAPYDQNPK